MSRRRGCSVYLDGGNDVNEHTLARLSNIDGYEASEWSGRDTLVYYDRRT